MREVLLVYDGVIEALFLHALRGRIDEDCRAQLRRAGLDLLRLEPTYPFSAWMRFLEVAASSVFADLPEGEAHRQLGRLVVQGYRETLLGRTLLSLLGILGPRKSIERATQTFRSGNNYTETRINQVAPTCYDLWMNEVGSHPELTQGIIEEGMRIAGAGDAQVAVLNHDGHACTYRITWRERKSDVPPSGQAMRRASSNGPLKDRLRALWPW